MKKIELRAMLVAPNRDLAQQFSLALVETRAFQILVDLNKYPSEQTLENRLRQFQPEVVLVDVASDPEAACGLIRRLVSLRPPVPVMGLDTSCRSGTMAQVLRAGASEFLAAPFDPDVQREAVANMFRLRQAEPDADAEPGKVIAFASAKPGSGASVLASQTAFALQRMTRQRVLLADLDLAAGTVGFYTARQHDCSFLDALEQAEQAGPAAWASLTTDCGGVDVLPAPSAPREMPLDPIRYHQVLDQARSQYGWTLLDLPSVFRRSSLLAVMGADRSFLVSTAELPSLHLTRKAVRHLGQAGVDRDRLEVVISQAGRESMSAGELEGALGCRVRMFLPDDARRLYQAVALGGPVESSSGFGEAIQRLAGRISGTAKSEKRQAGLPMKPGPAFVRA